MMGDAAMGELRWSIVTRDALVSSSVMGATTLNDALVSSSVMGATTLNDADG